MIVPVQFLFCFITLRKYFQNYKDVHIMLQNTINTKQHSKKIKNIFDICGAGSLWASKMREEYLKAIQQCLKICNLNWVKKSLSVWILNWFLWILHKFLMYKDFYEHFLWNLCKFHQPQAMGVSQYAGFLKNKKPLNLWLWCTQRTNKWDYGWPWKIWYRIKSYLDT